MRRKIHERGRERARLFYGRRIRADQERLRRMKSYTEFTIWLIDLNHYYRMKQWDIFMLGNGGSRAANGDSVTRLSTARSISSVENAGTARLWRRRTQSRAFKPEEISRVFNLLVTENRLLATRVRARWTPEEPYRTAEGPLSCARHSSRTRFSLALI